MFLMMKKINYVILVTVVLSIVHRMKSKKKYNVLHTYKNKIIK